MTRAKNKAKNAAAKAFQAAVEAETEGLHKDLAEAHGEIRRLHQILARIGKLATDARGFPVDPPDIPLEPLHPRSAELAPDPAIGPDGKEDFGPGTPVDQRPKAVFEEEPSTGPEADLDPRDIQGEGRWV